MKEISPYGEGASTSSSSNVPTRIRIPHLQKLKAQGKKWAMLTAYDMYTAAIFEQAGIPRS